MKKGEKSANIMEKMQQNIELKCSNQGGDFLQSVEWKNFQTIVGRKTHLIEKEDPASSAGRFSASIIEHELPIVGKYLYCPRGPVFSCHSERSVAESKNLSPDSSTTVGMTALIDLAKGEKAGWIRIEPENEKSLNLIKESTNCKIVRAPHDVQPREVFVLDISKSAEQLLAEMKPKTRYNIGVAKKKGVKIFHTDKACHPELAVPVLWRDSESREIAGSELNSGIPDQARNDSEFYINEFLRLTKEMADRHGITAHPEKYYRKMIETFPEEMLKIYVAEFEGEIIAANLVLFYGDTATYLHGASGNAHRNLMAPFLLQWQAILDAKEKGCTRYDFGGVHTQDTRYKIQDTNKWEGITTFKMGFSPSTKSLEFPGTYDIIVNPRKYAVYKGLQRAKAFAKVFKR